MAKSICNAFKASALILGLLAITPHANAQIEVTHSVNALKSGLNKKYVGYTVEFSNKGDDAAAAELKIDNAIPGPVAYEVVYQSPWKGLWWALIPYAGIVIGPGVSIKNGAKNAQSMKEAENYPGLPNNINLGPGETKRVNALVPFGQTPDVKLAYRLKGPTGPLRELINLPSPIAPSLTPLDSHQTPTLLIPAEPLEAITAK